ncbi:SNF2 family N-terminal domain-containing protein [Ephemerocybe angulata]|uniref:SNF2 family N-terminal domain-containing protein n=1 Tax=Ephemerocybe angulata TaxID=980116 RepID=A0A8H6I2N4_9AGAR|nr:SNF2 family N-terminal domain-containing protein [Tulosesus angulatus]
MLDTVSIHHESINTTIEDIWQKQANTNIPALNLALVERQLERLEDATNKAGKKRPASSEDTEQDAKRARLSNGHYTPPPATERNIYPDFAPTQPFRLEERSSTGTPGSALVMKHALDIHYDDFNPEIWPRFAQLLEGLGSEPAELGPVTLVAHEGRIVATQGRDGEWLTVLPRVTEGVDEDDDEYTLAPSTVDLITACEVLRRARKVELDTRLSLTRVDNTCFRIHVEILVSLCLPAIFLRLSQKEPKRHFELVAHAQRRLLSAVYGVNGGKHDVNISYFYSILGSAPPLPSPLADDAMQPDLLNPTLLPFQRRSVGWLLHREGRDVTPKGEIVPASKLDDFSFWTPVTEGNHTWYYNQLDGMLSPEPPEEQPAALGGILAEEPGLGKTLEMISLVLLDPPGPERNPSVTRWDPEARLDVKAIKTSLIVTPPALASQWVDEIAAHAPSLKVFIYEGWSKVKVPITRTQLEEERAAAAAVAAEKEKKEKARLAREAKGKGGKAREAKRKMQKELEALPADMGPDLTRDEEGNLLVWHDFVQQYDIVITTYQVLRSDFNVARAPPVRPRREDVKYVNVERPRSPLVMVEWNRVIMDEVQMVGGAKLEDMVSLIPRLSSYAVSGTPARAQISDLIHVVKFLRVFDVIGSERLWKRLIKPGFANMFSEFIQHYAIRTTKASVKSELTIPQQTRYLVPIELGKIERHVYDQTLETILLELGLDARGVAATDGWEVDGTLLRSSIRRLRGICTHPQVGQLQRKGDTYKQGALKSMDDVLENMRDQNWKNLMEDWKAKIQLIIRYAQLVQQNEMMDRSKKLALEAYQLAETEANKHIKEIEDLLKDHQAKGEILKKEAAALRLEQTQARAVAQATAGIEEPAQSQSLDKGKGKAKAGAESDDDDEDDEEEDNLEDKGLPKTPAGKEHRARTQALKTRLREGKLLLHKVKFLMGDIYHNMEMSAEEDAAYDHAEKLRQDLLKVTEDDASRAMAQLEDDMTRKRFKIKDLNIKVPFLGQGGIRSDVFMDEVNALIANVLNDQAELVVEWRSKIVELLTQKLTGKGDDDEGDGQEYQRNLDNQGEAEAYMQAYAALLADRREALVNERTLLAAHDVREKKLRHTKAAMKAATALDIPVMENTNDVELQPEHEVMYKDLSDERKELLQRLQGRAIKSVLVDLNAVLQRLTDSSKDAPEKAIVKKAVADIRTLMTSQSQLHDKLDADLILIRRAFNERILYFRQLQEISDSVADVEWDQDSLADAIQECQQERADVDAKINTSWARHRYLENLVQNKGAVTGGDDDGDEENTCILCRCDFVRGFITQCAHIYCEGCMVAWLQRREGKTCPVCRVAINPDTVHRFTVNAADADAPKQPVGGEAAIESKRKITYNFIDPGVFEKIQKFESLGDFGTKIQTLVRHLLYLQTEEPGAKSIVFSAWADSLHIVEWALHTNGIRCLRIDQKSKGESAAKKFRTDPDILVLLLHGEKENAGLNVTCASRVFLLESVVHHSFEIQAIARIDRMGQTRPTEVYCYYAEDTVERNILDLAARKGLSLYTKDKAAGTLDVTNFSQENDEGVVDIGNSPTKKSKAGKGLKGDFIFKIDDMLAVLFPHMYEEIQFLIPAEELGGDVEMADGTDPFSSSTNTARVRQNAVAGPSRLR